MFAIDFFNQPAGKELVMKQLNLANLPQNSYNYKIKL